MSKRKLTKLVDEKFVEGWNDPRFPTLRGLWRKGLSTETLIDFALSQGGSKNTATLQWEKLWNLNKIFLDPKVPRYVGFEKKNVVIMSLEGTDEKLVTKQIPKHKKNSSLGNKTTYYTNKIYLNVKDLENVQENEEITLMDWGNAIITKIVKENNVIKSLNGKLFLAGDVKKTKLKANWLAVCDKLVEFDVCEFSNLLTKDKILPDENFLDYVNPNSKQMKKFIGDPNIASLKVDEQIQLERQGYYRVDSVNPLTLFEWSKM